MQNKILKKILHNLTKNCLFNTTKGETYLKYYYNQKKPFHVYIIILWAFFFYWFIQPINEKAIVTYILSLILYTFFLILIHSFSLL